MAGAEIFREPLSRETIQRLADEEFGNMVKFVADLDQEIESLEIREKVKMIAGKFFKAFV